MTSSSWWLSGKRGCLRWVGIAIGSFVALIVALALTGMAYGRIAHARELRQFPPPGELVDVDGYKLHINCTGEGSPTVVIEAGSASWTLDWVPVQPKVAEFARVCTYDRAGYGWSQPGPRPRTGAQIVAELHTLLENAGVEGPYVLVGHSLGGIFVRLYAAECPDEVVGMVLVDARHEDFASRMTPESQEAGAASDRMFSTLGLMTRLGLLRLLGSFMGEEQLPPQLQYLPPEVHQEYLTVGYQAKYFDAVLDEGAVVEESDALVRSAGPLRDMPLVVLTHGVPDPTALGAAPEQAEEVEQIWQELQQDLTKLSSNSTLLVAEESGHAIPGEQPDAVVDAIRQVVEAARR